MKFLYRLYSVLIFLSFLILYPSCILLGAPFWVITGIHPVELIDKCNDYFYLILEKTK